MSDEEITINLLPMELDGFTETFALLGRYVSTFQIIEDYLPAIFFKALKVDRPIAEAIFDTAKGLDKKMALINAAMIGHPEKQDRWKTFAARISKHMEQRGQLAHGQPTTTGKWIVVPAPAGGAELYMNQSNIRFDKVTPKGAVTFTHEQLEDFVKDANKLFMELIDFKTFELLPEG